MLRRPSQNCLHETARQNATRRGCAFTGIHDEGGLRGSLLKSFGCGGNNKGDEDLHLAVAGTTRPPTCRHVAVQGANPSSPSPHTSSNLPLSSDARQHPSFLVSHAAISSHSASPMRTAAVPQARPTVRQQHAPALPLSQLQSIQWDDIHVIQPAACLRHHMDRCRQVKYRLLAAATLERHGLMHRPAEKAHVAGLHKHERSFDFTHSVAQLCCRLLRAA